MKNLLLLICIFHFFTMQGQIDAKLSNPDYVDPTDLIGIIRGEKNKAKNEKKKHLLFRGCYCKLKSVDDNTDNRE